MGDSQKGRENALDLFVSKYYLMLTILTRLRVSKVDSSV